MSRPICFVIMPYGVRETQPAPGSKAPDKVDYDKLWEDAYRPAIEAIGHEAVRADFDLGGMIIKDMLQRLGLCDLVIADISIPNANVYYEVGIRHAAKANGCVLFAAKWADVPFDLSQVRQLRYAMPSQEIDKASADAIIKLFKTKVLKLAEGNSPFHASIPGFPDVKRGELSAFKTKLLELSDFQSEVHLVRDTVSDEKKRIRAHELRDKYFSGGVIQEAVALELLYLLRDCTDPKTTVEFIDRLPKNVRDLPVVHEQRAFMQSSLGNHEQAINVLKELIQATGDTPERQGLIGGRYKRLWKDAKDPKEKSAYLDLAIDHYDQGMHLDLNEYYSACNLPLLYATRNEDGDAAKAAVAAAITRVACERARRRDSTDPWLKPTLLGAAFFAGDALAAGELVAQIKKDKKVGWQLDTTIADLETALAITPAERVDALRKVLDAIKKL
jgi:hypothetical protein